MVVVTRFRRSLPVLCLVAVVVLPGCMDEYKQSNQDGAAGALTLPAADPDEVAALAASSEAVTSAVSAAASAAEFPDANPFGYRNPWRQ